jgi:uncharacterized protein YdeI (BOF family)
MATIKSVAIAAALLVGASSLAMAQTSGNTGNSGSNAAASGGPGTHAGAMQSGSAANSRKVEKNQNGYTGGHE